MKKSVVTLLVSGLLFICHQTGMGQESLYRKANKKYGHLTYIDASEIYLHVAEKGYRSVELLQKLGNTFYFNAKYDEAAHWYTALFDLAGSAGTPLEPIYYLRLSKSLQASGNEVEAQKWFGHYTELVPQNRPRTVAEEHGHIDRLSGRYTIKNLDINTGGLDFGASYVGDNLVFASTRDTGSLATRINSWDNRAFLKLFEAPMHEDGSPGKVTRLKDVGKNRFHASSAVFTKGGDTLYFTRNNATADHTKEKEKKLKIYRVAQRPGGGWGNLEDLSINGDGFNTAHPALSPDGRKLYFASDRTGSMGQTDIFVVDIKENGALGTPRNLGPKVNTRGRESFPFVSERNELYFASDGHYGLGGYDVFHFDLSKPGMPSNVGQPINSEMDDFAFAIDVNKKKGHFSSNRPGGKGNDDIYSFVELVDIAETFKNRLYGKVTDRDTREPLNNTTITLFNEKGDRFNELKTDAMGNYSAEVPDGISAYRVLFNKEGYDSDDVQVVPEDRPNELNATLKRNTFTLEKDGDLASMLNIQAIYFDFDKSNILPGAEVELQKALVALQQFPNLKIDIRSHTDSQGTDAYNLELSEKRARSTMEWLVSKGIDRGRLTAKGYGESQLVNRCSHERPCSEQEHQRNRRSEFMIVE